MRLRTLLITMVVGYCSAFAQNPTYQYRLMNDLQVSSTIYEFDIYLKRTGATALEVANTQVGLNFNGAIRNGGTLTFSLVSGTSEFLAGQVPTSFSVDTTNKILRIQAKTNPGSGNGTIIADTGVGTKFGRFRITDSSPFGSFTPDLSWNFISTGGRFPSRLSAYVATVATDVTVPDSHSVNLVNPILNASVSGQAFNDLNGNGARDAGEPGLQNWRVRLSQGGTQIDSTLTDAGGNYGFPALAPGTYSVSEQMQAGWALTSTPSSYTIVVTSGSFSANNNFGNIQLGSINGMKFNDVDGDGVKDGGEAGLSGWRIRLSKDGTPVDSALTDGTGAYTFTNLLAGSYTVSEAAQAGWLQTFPVAPGTYPVNIVSGTVATGKDFGNYQYGSIGGQKFNDLNGNGVKDAGEPGLAGWTIQLTGPVNASTTTGPAGDYTFTGLTAGNYQVSEQLQGGWVQSYPAGGTHAVAIVSGSSVTGKDFGNYQLGQISGTKFEDLDGDGVKDAGEPGLSGWRIRLMKNGVPFDSALSDGSGAYSFVGLNPASYLVSEALQAGWVQTMPAAPGTYSLTLTSGGISSGNDLGNFHTGSVSGLAYNDLDGNGTRGGGEPVVAGVRIRLFKGGVRIDSALTAADGSYAFAGVGNGSYTIGEEVPAGWVQTAPAAPGTYAVTMTSNGTFPSRNFGNFQLSSISGVKFNDQNGNGVKDAGEPGLLNWRIRLSKNGVPYDSALTDAGGAYTFQGLAAGSYTVTEASQAGWSQTMPAAPGSYSMSVTSGTSTTGRDFGNFQLGIISGTKYEDLNGNGVKDAGEPAVADWRIRLQKGGVVVDSALTSAGGGYTFGGLTAGNYVVSEAAVSGWMQTSPPSPGTWSLVVASGTVHTGADFGNFKLGSIAGTVFLDSNANGSRDTLEGGIAGWRVRLSKNGVPVDSVLTNGSGQYTFSDLAPASYAVSEELTGTWHQSKPAAPGTYTLAMTSGLVSTVNDFGNFQNGSIEGYVFEDLNANGVRDAGEPPVANWQVRLLGLKTDSLLTDTAGHYAFADLTPGLYEVRQTIQSGWIQTFPASQGTHTVNLTSGTTAGSRSFGNFRTVGISGVKFNDLNANGVRDLGEPGLPGWRIRLAKGGSPIDSLLTDSLGAYLFQNLLAGSYLVSEVQQAGWSQSMPASPGTYSIELVSGSSAPGRDFGNYQLGSIAGSAFIDSNGNGVRDTGELGYAGLRIRLTGTKTDSILTDALGQYTFPNLVPGSYGLSEATPASWFQTLPASGAPYALNLTSGGSVSGRDFGLFQSGTISGMVFNDLDGDGVKDSLDGGLSGWKVRLSKAGVVVDSSTSTASGTYQFTGVGPGTYSVAETTLAGWIRTAPSTPGTHTIVMTTGLAAPQKNFGNYQLAVISGIKFNDRNANGVRDSAELGLSGWTIVLGGTAHDTVITDGAGAYAFDSLLAGTYTVAEVQQEGWLQTHPGPDSSYTLTVGSGETFSATNFGNTLIPTLGRKMLAGWNMVSVPVAPLSGDLSKTSVFPDAISNAYSFDGGYSVREVLAPGVGYWIKYPSSLIVSLDGVGVQRETVAVAEGWNLIGTISTLFPASMAVSDPPGIISSPFFAYFGSYAIVDTLEPFHGYWVKVSAPGNLVISDDAPGTMSQVNGKSVGGRPVGGSAGTVFSASKDETNVLLFRDAAGHTQRLLFGDTTEIDSRFCSAPPPPPAGSFDARFASDRLTEAYVPGAQEAVFPVRLQAEHAPVDVTWTINRADRIFELCIEEGAVKRYVPMSPGGSVRLEKPSSSRISLVVRSEADVPKSFALEQNYPNPFNPATDIRYALPVRSRVTLTVYNTLGQVVERIVNEVEEAGRHQQRWTPDLASGVYYYRLEAAGVDDQAQSFDRTMKMLYIR